ncbi:MAG: 16S rRNA (adenine(1518)-N(6)/adenine(1519)-N(6))-dimethyltransferase RsmA [Firmicutes bacterium]|nr:16S rRNA (adenine(1518)-N(6)/adenine(1519)-N(6))-dimethyltransferase RsmA [Bacillota bacterium]
MKLLDRLRQLGFEFKKGLGQNFILDETYLDGVVRDLGLSTSDNVVEVGAGAGTFTRALSRVAGNVLVYEIDTRLEEILDEQFRELDNVKVVFQDGLRADISEHITGEYKVTANVPYYITTPLLFKFAHDPNCRQINVLVQEEVAKRIIAGPGSNDYGALSIGMQAWGDCKITRRVPRSIFIPQPNVDSAFVQITRHTDRELDWDGFGKMLKGIFMSRRKTMLNAVSGLKLSKEVTAELLHKCGIDATLRPENITVRQYIDLFDQIRGLL